MNAILISIVSDQPIPNVLFCREMIEVEKYEIAEYIFLTTQRMQEQQKLEQIIMTLGISTGQYREIRVPEYSLVDITEQLRTAEFSREHKYLVNITNGTKLMSTATYNFFTQAGFAAELYYVMFGQNEYRQLFPAEQRTVRRFTYRLTLVEYLNSHGVALQEGRTQEQLVQSPVVTQTVFAHDWNHRVFRHPKTGKTDTQLKRNLKKHFKTKKTPLVLSDWIAANPDFAYFPQQLRESPMDLQDPLAVQPAEWEYLRSSWFEEYVFNLVLQHIVTIDPTTEIVLGAKISQLTTTNVTNELDVIFLFQNELYVIECKTHLVGMNAYRNQRNKPTGTRVDDAMYKLAALKKDFGLQIIGYLFALDGLTERNSTIIPPYWQHRADILGIKLVTKSMLHQEVEMQHLFKPLHIRQPKLFLIFSHQLTELQQQDALLSLKVPPDHIEMMPADLIVRWTKIPVDRTLRFGDYLNPITNWLRENARTGDYILIQGEFGAVFHLVNFCRRYGLTPLHATSERRMYERINSAGEIEKYSAFSHIAFREYRTEV